LRVVAGFRCHVGASQESEDVGQVHVVPDGVRALSIGQQLRDSCAHTRLLVGLLGLDVDARTPQGVGQRFFRAASATISAKKVKKAVELTAFCYPPARRRRVDAPGGIPCAMSDIEWFWWRPVRPRWP
jgi:hypothetical protein